jgi:hypothetical protein
MLEVGFLQQLTIKIAKTAAMPKTKRENSSLLMGMKFFYPSSGNTH